MLLYQKISRDARKKIVLSSYLKKWTVETFINFITRSFSLTRKLSLSSCINILMKMGLLGKAHDDDYRKILKSLPLAKLLICSLVNDSCNGNCDKATQLNDDWNVTWDKKFWIEKHRQDLVIRRANELMISIFSLVIRFLWEEKKYPR